MGLRIPKGGLRGPEDMPLLAGGGASFSGGGRGPAEWGVKDPVPFALAGLQHAVEVYGDTYAQTKANDFLLKTQKEIDRTYFDPQNGQFNTRKGGAAVGMYGEWRGMERDIWDKRAQEELSPRQRELVKPSFTSLFRDMRLKIGSFQAENMLSGQIQDAKVHIGEAINMAATGMPLDDDRMLRLLDSMETSYANQGRMEGWSPEYTKLQFETGRSKALANMAVAAGDKDPMLGLGILRSNRELILPVEYREAEKNLAHKSMSAMAAENPMQGLAMVEAALSSKEGLGNSLSFVAGKESNNDPAAIGYDQKGGTSYGKYQIASKPGTMEDFLSWLGKSGKGELADKLKAAGPADSGSRSGKMAEAWRSAVASGELTEGDQDRFIQETHINPVLDGLTAAQRDVFDSSPGLEAALYSTAVQHGPAGALKIINRAWSKSGGDAGRFVKEMYADRATQFGGSDEKTRAAVQARLQREQEEVLGMKGGTPEGSGLTGVFSRAELMAYRHDFMEAIKGQQKLIDERQFTAAYSFLWQQSQGMTPEGRDAYMAEKIMSMPTAAMREAAWDAYEKDKRVVKAQQGGRDADLRRDFLKQMEGKGISEQMQSLPGLLEQGMSTDAFAALSKEIASGPQYTAPEAFNEVTQKIISGQYEDVGDLLKDMDGRAITSKDRNALQDQWKSLQDYKSMGFDAMLNGYTDNLEALGVAKEEKPKFMLALQEALDLKQRELGRRLNRQELRDLLLSLTKDAATGEGFFGQTRRPVYELLTEIPITAQQEIGAHIRRADMQQGYAGPVTPQRIVREWLRPENEEYRNRYSADDLTGMAGQENEPHDYSWR